MRYIIWGRDLQRLMNDIESLKLDVRQLNSRVGNIQKRAEEANTTLDHYFAKYDPGEDDTRWTYAPQVYAGHSRVMHLLQALYQHFGLKPEPNYNTPKVLVVEAKP